MREKTKKVSISDIMKRGNAKRVVYKYRDWKNKNHKKLLTDNIMYLASPRDFNDPFDCRINKNFSLLTDQERDKYINDMAIKYYPTAESKGESFDSLLRNFEERMKNIKEIQVLADSNLYSMQDDYYAIFSCSEVWNNILMWSHYANFHTGICVGLKTKELLKSGVIGKFGKVVYRKSFPKIKPKVLKSQDDWDYAESFVETHTKAIGWSYEQEVRFHITSTRALCLEDRLIQISDNYFDSVILGIRIPDEDKQEIVEICKTKKVKVYQAVKKDFKFEITRSRIL